MPEPVSYAAPKARTVIDNLALLRAFVAVVECGNFSRAGQRLRVVPSTISKHIAALEAGLGVRLFVRSTQTLSVTEVGHAFYEKAVTILENVESAEQEVGRYNAEPQGVLRISAGTVFAQRHIMPIILDFMAVHPKVAVDLDLSTTTKDLAADGVDVAIRISNNLDPGLIAMKLAHNIRLYCASPAYLRKYGTPQNAADLRQHNCLVVRGVNHSAKWPIRNADGTTEEVTVTGSLVSDNGDLIRQGLLAGLGIGRIAHFMVDDHLRSGELVEVFPESRAVASHIYAVYSARRNIPLKTRAFLDRLKMAFRHGPPWEK